MWHEYRQAVHTAQAFTWRHPRRWVWGSGSPNPGISWKLARELSGRKKKKLLQCLNELLTVRLGYVRTLVASLRPPHDSFPHNSSMTTFTCTPNSVQGLYSHCSNIANTTFMCTGILSIPVYMVVVSRPVYTRAFNFPLLFPRRFSERGVYIQLGLHN